MELVSVTLRQKNWLLIIVVNGTCKLHNTQTGESASKSFDVSDTHWRLAVGEWFVETTKIEDADVLEVADKVRNHI